VRFGPTQIHPQNHLGPVLRLGAAGAGLNVEVGIVEVHLTRKHAAKLERRELLFESGDIPLDFADRVGVVFLDRERQQLVRVIQTRREFIEYDDNLLELRTLLPQRLRALGFIPDIGLLEFALDLGQTFRFALVVKDTPSTR
jgi:Fe2+ transport system protein FeoA